VVERILFSRTGSDSSTVPAVVPSQAQNRFTVVSPTIGQLTIRHLTIRQSQVIYLKRCRFSLTRLSAWNKFWDMLESSVSK
jgi:hypothetical protein